MKADGGAVWLQAFRPARPRKCHGSQLSSMVCGGVYPERGSRQESAVRRHGNQKQEVAQCLNLECRHLPRPAAPRGQHYLRRAKRGQRHQIDDEKEMTWQLDAGDVPRRTTYWEDGRCLVGCGGRGTGPNNPGSRCLAHEGWQGRLEESRSWDWHDVQSPLDQIPNWQPGGGRRGPFPLSSAEDQCTWTSSSQSIPRA